MRKGWGRIGRSFSRIGGVGMGIAACGRIELTGHEVIVDAQAGPSVDRGIDLLPRAQLLGFPVAQTLTFGDAAVEDYAVDFLQARIRDVEIFHHCLQVDEIGRFERCDTWEPYLFSSKMLLVSLFRRSVSNNMIFRYLSCIS